MNAHIALLPGDGIGPEVIGEARRTLEALAAQSGHRFTFEERPIGGRAIDETGDPLPPATLEACRRADAVLLGAVGGPKWDDPQAPKRPEDGLLALRKELKLFANLRPVRPRPDLAASSPLRAEVLRGVDLLIVRELTGGLYFGRPRGREKTGGEVKAVDTLVYTGSEIRRLVELGFQMAQGRRGHLTSVDKANVLETSRLWRSVVDKVAEEYPDVTVQHLLVDAAAMRLIRAPTEFDVVVTENLFGDILSDEASVLTGSLGMLPSASLGSGGGGIFEPVHGSAPDIAGRGTANPTGALLSAGLLLRHALRLSQEADELERAVDAVLASEIRTPDLGGSSTTTEFAAAVRQALSVRREPAAESSTREA